MLNYCTSMFAKTLRIKDRLAKPYRQIKKIIAGITQVILSSDGASGPGTRPVVQEWVTDIRDQCLRVKVPFFCKQWGGVHLCLPKTTGTMCGIDAGKRKELGEPLKVAHGMR